MSVISRIQALLALSYVAVLYRNNYGVNAFQHSAQFRQVGEQSTTFGRRSRSSSDYYLQPLVRTSSHDIRSKRNTSSPRHQLNAVPPELLHHDVQQSMQHFMDVMAASSSTLLADASEAVVDAADAAKDEGGWWQNYLNLFKSGLLFVHSTVDQPLKNMGVEHTWGPSIAIFTAGVRAALLPLSYQQSKGTEYTKALKPYQDEIKQKFKDNKDMQNRAIAKLFEDAQVNPLNGCLLSLAQLPIFIGLYRSVTSLAKDDLLSEPFLWIPSLGGPVSPPTYRGMEWLTQGWTFDGIPTPSLGWETTLAFLIMPVVLVLGQAFTMSVLTPPVDENASAEEKESFEKSQRILKFLPLMIGYFSLQVPAGLTIYWFTSNVFSTTQSLLIRLYYKLNPPKINLPDYWDALDDVSNMSAEEQRKAAEAGLRAGPKFEDLVDEARYHAVIERPPLRLAMQSSATTSSATTVPAEFKDWVAASTASSASAASSAFPSHAVSVKEDISHESNGADVGSVNEPTASKEAAEVQ